MYWYGEGMGAGWYWLMGVSWILFLAVVVAGIVLAVRYFSRGGRQPGSGPWGGHPRERGAREQPPGAYPPGAGEAPRAATPEEVLAERYARGEIDDEEYQRRLTTLRASAGAGQGHGR